MTTKTWGAWCRLVEPYWDERGGLRDDAPLEAIGSALGEGNSAVDHRLYSMSKGYALLRASVQDENPAIGRGSPRETPSRLDFVRGLQWRLVMAVGGLEVFLRGRFGRPKDYLSKLASRAAHLVHTGPPRLPMPRGATRGEEQLGRWVSGSPDDPGGERLSEFLGLSSWDREVFLRWARSPTSIEGWEDQIRLACALRNMTAHGALSARKAQQLQLRGPIRALPVHLLKLAGDTLAPAIEGLGNGIT